MISCASAVTMTITTAEHSYKTMQKTRKHKRYVCVPMLLAFVTLALDTVLWGMEDGRGKGRTVANQEQTRIPHVVCIGTISIFYVDFTAIGRGVHPQTTLSSRPPASFKLASSFPCGGIRFLICCRQQQIISNTLVR